MFYKLEGDVMSKIKENEIQLKIIEDFRRNTADNFEEKDINEAVTKLFPVWSNKYEARCTVAGALIYTRFTVKMVSDGKYFAANGFGLNSVGMGQTMGYVYTNNLD
ncbi:hypothetical protein, partial [Xenorhabdus innexi]